VTLSGTLVFATIGTGTPPRLPVSRSNQTHLCRRLHRLLRIPARKALPSRPQLRVQICPEQHKFESPATVSPRPSVRAEPRRVYL
jgi:hypothetical protein